MAAQLNKAREELAQMFLSSLDKEKLPWQQPWNAVDALAGYGMQENPVSGSRYRGINALMLWVVSLDKGYIDPRWCTFKQAQEKGWNVKKGEKGTHVEFWSYYDVPNKKKLSWKEAAEIVQNDPERRRDIKCISHVYTVFNAAQIEGIPSIDIPPPPDPEYREQLLADFSARYLEAENIPLHTGLQAYYRPSEDSITMPPKESFAGEMEYYDVLFHECAHSTGAAKRLNRPSSLDKRTASYAIEELRAEIAGAFILSGAGYSVSPKIRENNVAYIQSWVSEIKEKPKVLFDAIKDAGIICDFVCERGELERLKADAKDMEQVDSTSFTPEQIEEFARRFHAAEQAPAPTQIGMTI